MLCRYRDLPEAMVARSKLDAYGIRNYLDDENVVRLDWFWSNLIGGVKLRVAAEDAERALSVLSEEIPDSFQLEEVGEEYKQPACPNCGSLDVGFETIYRGIAFAVLEAFALPLPIPRNAWLCADCGHCWKDEYV